MIQAALVVSSRVRMINRPLRRVVHNDFGKEVWILSKMYPVFDKQNELTGVCLVAINVTHRKRMEKSVMENEVKFRKIIETAPIPIIIVNKDLQITLANPETEKIFQYSTEELLDKDINILIPERFKPGHADLQKSYFHSQKYHQMGLNRLIPARAKDGSEKYVEVRLNSFVVKGEIFVLAIIQDLTQRIAHENQLKKQVEMLEKIAWEHAHEIRKPVANVLGLVNLIDMDKEKGYNPLLIDKLKDTALELDDIIHRIIHYTKA